MPRSGTPAAAKYFARRRASTQPCGPCAVNPVHHQKDLRAHSCLQVECSDATDGKSTWTNNAAGQTYSPRAFFKRVSEWACRVS